MFADTSTSQAIVCQCSDLKVSKKVLVGIILCGYATKTDNQCH